MRLSLAVAALTTPHMPFKPPPSALPNTHTQGVLFQEGSYTIASKHANLIAFNCDLGLLLRVLRTAFSHDAERLDVKLIQKRVRAGPESEELVPRPHLSFTHVVGGLMVTLPVGALTAGCCLYVHRFEVEARMNACCQLQPHLPATLPYFCLRSPGGHHDPGAGPAHQQALHAQRD